MKPLPFSANIRQREKLLVMFTCIFLTIVLSGQINYLMQLSLYEGFSPAPIIPHTQSLVIEERWKIYLYMVYEHTAKTQYRKFETNIPRKVIARPQSQYPHSCVCDGFIYSQDQSAYSAAGKYVDRSLWIYKSLTDTWMWKLGLRPRNFFSGIT